MLNATITLYITIMCYDTLPVDGTVNLWIKHSLLSFLYQRRIEIFQILARQKMLFLMLPSTLLRLPGIKRKKSMEWATVLTFYHYPEISKAKFKNLVCEEIVQFRTHTYGILLENFNFIISISQSKLDILMPRFDHSPT